MRGHGHREVATRDAARDRARCEHRLRHEPAQPLRQPEQRADRHRGNKQGAKPDRALRTPCRRERRRRRLSIQDPPLALIRGDGDNELILPTSGRDVSGRRLRAERNPVFVGERLELQVRIFRDEHLPASIDNLEVGAARELLGAE